MSRSLKKGPFVDDHLMKKVRELGEDEYEEEEVRLMRIKFLSDVGN